MPFAVFRCIVIRGTQFRGAQFRGAGAGAGAGDFFCLYNQLRLYNTRGPANLVGARAALHDGMAMQTEKAQAMWRGRRRGSNFVPLLQPHHPSSDSGSLWLPLLFWWNLQYSSITQEPRRVSSYITRCIVGNPRTIRDIWGSECLRRAWQSPDTQRSGGRMLFLRPCLCAQPRWYRVRQWDVWGDGESTEDKHATDAEKGEEEAEEDVAFNGFRVEQ